MEAEQINAVELMILSVRTVPNIVDKDFVEIRMVYREDVKY